MLYLTPREMFKKIIYILTPILILTILFLVFVLIINKQGGKGALQVTSKPISQVFIDGEYVGNTPLSLIELEDLLSVGEFDIKLIPTEKGFKEWEQKINIHQRALTVVDRTFDKNLGASSGSIITLTDINDKNKSELLVVSFPSKAQVILDSKDRGITPVLIDDITASDHEIKILKDGYREKVVKVKTINGKKLEVLASLGIRTDLTEEISDASESAILISKVTILETPIGFLRVRQSPSLNSEQINTVEPGEELEYISEVDGWYQIILLDGSNGWISSEYAQLLED